MTAKTKTKKVKSKITKGHTIMDKVKIKRVKKNNKKVTTEEKILAGLGLGSTLLGMGGSVSTKPPTSQIVRTQTNESSGTSKIKQKLKSIFGISEAHAMEEDLNKDFNVNSSDLGPLNIVPLSEDPSQQTPISATSATPVEIFTPAEVISPVISEPTPVTPPITTTNLAEESLSSSEIENQRIAQQAALEAENLRKSEEQLQAQNQAQEKAVLQAQIDAQNAANVKAESQRLAEELVLKNTQPLYTPNSDSVKKPETSNISFESKTSEAGTFSEGVVNGQKIAILNGKVYNNQGQDITSSYSSDDLNSLLQASELFSLPVSPKSVNLFSPEKSPADSESGALGATTIYQDVKVSGLSVTNTINGAKQGIVAINGLAQTVAVMPDGRIFNTAGKDITALFSDSAAEELITAFKNAVPPSTGGPAIPPSPITVNAFNQEQFRAEFIKTSSNAGATVASGSNYEYMLGLGSPSAEDSKGRAGTDGRAWFYTNGQWTTFEALPTAPAVVPSSQTPPSTYHNVNDTLFLGKSAAEIAGIMAKNQGVTLAQALSDPTIQLFTDPAYRTAMTTPIAPAGLGTVDFYVVNQSTGQMEHTTRALGVISRSDADRIAASLGARVELEPKLLGQQQQDFTLVFPNGVRINASEVANSINNAQTPETFYNYKSQLLNSVNLPSSVEAAKFQAQVLTNRNEAAKLFTNTNILTPNYSPPNASNTVVPILSSATPNATVLNLSLPQAKVGVVYSANLPSGSWVVSSGNIPGLRVTTTSISGVPTKSGTFILELTDMNTLNKVKVTLNVQNADAAIAPALEASPAQITPGQIPIGPNLGTGNNSQEIKITVINTFSSSGVNSNKQIGPNSTIEIGGQNLAAYGSATFDLVIVNPDNTQSITRITNVTVSQSMVRLTLPSILPISNQNLKSYVKVTAPANSNVSSGLIAQEFNYINPGIVVGPGAVVSGDTLVATPVLSLSKNTSTVAVGGVDVISATVLTNGVESRNIVATTNSANVEISVTPGTGIIAIIGRQPGVATVVVSSTVSGINVQKTIVVNVTAVAAQRQSVGVVGGTGGSVAGAGASVGDVSGGVAESNSNSWRNFWSNLSNTNPAAQEVRSTTVVAPAPAPVGVAPVAPVSTVISGAVQQSQPISQPIVDTNAQNQVQGLNQTIIGLRNQITELQGRVSDLQSRPVTVNPQVDLSSLNSQIAALSAQISSQQSQLTQLQKNYNAPTKVAAFGTVEQFAPGLQMPTGLQMPANYIEPAQPAGASVQGNTYVVKKGDTLWGISKKYYGEGSKWRKILAANSKKIKTPKTLQIGTNLVIPPA